ncbi:RNA-guided endonuclease InsQ/TnpB family protein [Clostridium botulinum]|uniref:RNA-guided endonuclease InsQ/TnpB family protein n=1 Tax=Clostridium botulinum TaxID=1491 RepID=UPI00196701E3|nr:RNA-guided endonuclease TnpB family protein [Clostridium botulinum]
MKAQRIEKHVINKNHKAYKLFDEYCFKSKNIYNLANYTQRQLFINKEPILKYVDLSKRLNKTEAFKEIGSNSAQMTLKLVCQNWKSFFVSVKDYTKNPSKYLGKPKLPKYKDKNGRYIFTMTNMQTHIYDGYLFFAFKPLKCLNNLFKTKVTDKLLQTRVIPKGSIYVLEIVYEKEIQEPKEFNNRILGIDLGVNNLATCVNNVGVKPIIINGRPIKSINQYYNKKKSKLQADLKKRHKKDWSNKLDKLQRKRDVKIDYYLHCASKSIVNYCDGLDITQIVVGLNKTWKQESKLNNKINQNFISIPYDKFINMIKYKCEDVGISVIINEESYTSGCSFLDNELPIKENYNKSRRIVRGLFKSNNGQLINSDVNGAYNIIKKVIPNAFADGIEGVHLHPIRVNV